MKKALVIILITGCLIVGLVRHFKIGIKLGTNESKMLGNNEFVAMHIDKPLPEFTLRDMDGKIVSSQDLKGKRVHLNFWSVSCKPCIEEFSDLNRLKNQFGQRTVFLALAAEDSAKVNRVLKKRKFEYQVIPNAAQYFKQVKIDAYPKNFFVDSQGIIRHITEGSQQKLDGASLRLVSSNFEVYKTIIDNLD